MTNSPKCPFSVTEFETVPPDEEAEITETAELTVKLQEKRAATAAVQEGRVLRGVHPKSHGCTKAEFTICDDIADALQIGLFAHPGKTYSAWVRFSNASVMLDHDLKDEKNGSRGMAIKVMDVDGEMIDEDGGRHNQDFLMINTPEFAIANVRDYLRLDRIMDLDPNGENVELFFAPAKLAQLQKENVEPETQAKLKAVIAAHPLLNELTDDDFMGTFASARVVAKIQSKAGTVRNPTQVRYFGAAPFLFGPGKVMKFSARPVKEVPQEAFENITADNPKADYLRDAVTETVGDNHDIHFDFGILVRELGDADLNIENATTSWKEESENTAWDDPASSYHKVARITIPCPQDPVCANAIEDCEKLVFSPWHTLAAHQPVGGINRLRRLVYEESAKRRLDQEP